MSPPLPYQRRVAEPYSSVCLKIQSEDIRIILFQVFLGEHPLDGYLETEPPHFCRAFFALAQALLWKLGHIHVRMLQQTKEWL